MVDEIDRGIVLDAYDDCEMVRNVVREISVCKSITNEQALKDFVSRFSKLSELVPLELYLADVPFGKPTKIHSGPINLGAVLDGQGKIVGPPFLQFSRAGGEDGEQDFIDFFNVYGLPAAASKG